MIKKILLILILLLTGCTETAVIDVPKNESKTLRATCYMNNFQGFPPKVSGIVTLELRNLLTVLVKNKDGSESIEITFPKNKCKVN